MNKMAINTHLSVITLNALNAPIKKHGMNKYIKK